ncbi:hypothetical protein FA10DRAFT_270043 [Acaromyces ingoldii]|uniref:Uncharacterized protein n=1 Tax=Acaromyces ingoldii TaxID=215250 RepID=A0A316YF38_9BASI|nr:hypothetical protein FA10DRAFT_270043 [Acaromyces ingoldii]PWN86673.1 hypothetical protein FA10DRAFT_270043 [Acaromyces ingoldii]
MNLPTTYSLTSRLWPHDGFLQIVDQENNRLVGLSIEFMRKGHVLTWEYVEQTLSACIKEEGTICSVDGTHLDREQPPATGTYLFVRSGELIPVLP